MRQEIEGKVPAAEDFQSRVGHTNRSATNIRNIELQLDNGALPSTAHINKRPRTV